MTPTNPRSNCRLGYSGLPAPETAGALRDDQVPYISSPSITPHDWHVPSGIPLIEVRRMLS